MRLIYSSRPLAAHVQFLQANDIGIKFGYNMRNPRWIEVAIGADATVDVIAEDLEDLPAGRRCFG